MIPEDYKFHKETPSKTEVYNKAQIERFLAFDIKITKVLEEVTGKNYSTKYSREYNYITNLKRFRDAIIHTKKNTKGRTPYEHLFRESFAFKYEPTLHAVRDFINFYSPNLIEECDCGKDF